MRYGIISDIHSNLQALEESLKVIDKNNIDQIICLGDIVGYNANPTECINIIKSHPKINHIVFGNHDTVASETSKMVFLDLMNMSADALDGIRHSALSISKKDKKWLRSFTIEKSIEDADLPFLMSHYSPNMCTMDGYIMNKREAQIAAIELRKRYKVNVFLFGHSHVPTYARMEGMHRLLEFEIGENVIGKLYDISDKNSYYLINPGAIGQARGGGITSYAILDTKEKNIQIDSFKYNWKEAQDAVIEAGCSKSIADRIDPDYEKNRKKNFKKQRLMKF